MNKTGLTKVVVEKTKLTQKEASAATQGVLDTITNALANGEKVQILGFGTLEVRERFARTGRNPQTGEKIQIQASKAPAFKAGKQLKEAVQ
ncbi:HU family DNA-binding protein [Bacillus cereus]|nr:HU family DNA-binding protein [Bacillus cereus]